MGKRSYWIASVRIDDEEKYKKYLDYVSGPFGKYGGKYLVRAGRSKVVEGQGRDRNIIIEFPDYDTALACYASAEYQQAILLRKDASINDIIVVEGHGLW